MASRKRLPFPDTARVSVFRALERILKNNPALAGVVRPENWRSGEGQASDAQPLPTNQPGIRLRMVPGPEEMWSADNRVGPLFVMVELMVPGTCSDDLDNFFGAIEAALYPRDNHAAVLANVEALTAAGAHTGIPLFQSPASDPDPSSGQGGNQTGRAVIRIEVRSNFLSPPLIT